MKGVGGVLTLTLRKGGSPRGGRGGGLVPAKADRRETIGRWIDTGAAQGRSAVRRFWGSLRIDGRAEAGGPAVGRVYLTWSELGLVRRAKPDCRKG